MADEAIQQHGGPEHYNIGDEDSTDMPDGFTLQPRHRVDDRVNTSSGNDAVNQPGVGSNDNTSSGNVGAEHPGDDLQLTPCDTESERTEKTEQESIGSPIVDGEDLYVGQGGGDSLSQYLALAIKHCKSEQKMQKTKVVEVFSGSGQYSVKLKMSGLDATAIDWKGNRHKTQIQLSLIHI